MRTATISINVPAERYWPKGWERPADGLPKFRGTEPTPGRAGMEVLQDGEWIALPSKAALHIRVMTVQVSELRQRIASLSEALRQHRCNSDDRMSVGKCVDSRNCACCCGLLLD